MLSIPLLFVKACEGADLLNEALHRVKLAVDGGEADVGHVVQLLEEGQGLEPDLLRGDLRARDLVLKGVGEAAQDLLAHGALLAGEEEAP